MSYVTPTINDKSLNIEILLHMIIVLLSNSTNLIAPVYTTIQRDALIPTSGQLITNSDTGTLELYYGGVWNPFVING